MNASLSQPLALPFASRFACADELLSRLLVEASDVAIAGPVGLRSGGVTPDRLDRERLCARLLGFDRRESRSSIGSQVVTDGISPVALQPTNGTARQVASQASAHASEFAIHYTLHADSRCRCHVEVRDTEIACYCPARRLLDCGRVSAAVPFRNYDAAPYCRASG
jgi:hypothetical protein